MPKRAVEVLTESMLCARTAFQEGPMCGIEIVDFADKKTRGRVRLGPAALYTILGKFEREKYMRELEIAGRRRRYALTEKGALAYGRELARLELCLGDAGGKGAGC